MDIKEITSTILKLKELCETVSQHFSTEHDLAKRIVWDLANLNREKSRLVSELGAVEAQIEIAKKDKESMILSARTAADQVREIIAKRNVESLQLLEKVKDFVDKTDKKSYLALKESLVA